MVNSMKKVPHIKVDATALVDPKFSGVGHYTLGIVEMFDEMAAEGKLTYTLIVTRNSKHRLKKFNLKHYKRVITNPVPHRIIKGFIWHKWPVPLDLILGPGNYYFPNFEKWPLWFSRSAVVVHDITYAAVPECVPEETNRTYLNRIMPGVVKKAAAIIAVSRFSKREIAKFHNVPEEKIFVASPSIDKELLQPSNEAEIKRVKAKYNIFSKGYLLSIGNLEPRKNYERLIDAYTSLPKNITDNYPLVTVGAGGWDE